MGFICDAGRYEKDLNGLSGKDLAVIIVMTSSTVATERSKDVVDDYTDLQEYDGTSYDRQVIAAGDWTLTRNDTDHRNEFTFPDVTLTTLGAGAANAIGMLLALIMGADEDADTDNIPLAYVNSSTRFPFQGDGNDVVIRAADTGVLQFGGA